MADSLFALNGGGQHLPFLIPGLDIGDKFFSDPDHRAGYGRGRVSAGASIPGMPKMDARASDIRFWENRYNAALGRVAEMIPRYPSMEYALKSPDVIKTLNEAIPSVSEQVAMSNMKKQAEAYDTKIRDLEAGEEVDVRNFENALTSGNINGDSFRTLGQSAQHHFDVESMYGNNGQQKPGFYTYDQPIGTLQQTKQGIGRYFENLGSLSSSGGGYSRDKNGNLIRIPTGGGTALQKTSSRASSNIFNIGFDPRDPSYDEYSDKYNPQAVMAIGDRVMKTLSPQELYGAKSGYIKEWYGILNQQLKNELTPEDKQKRLFEMTNGLREDNMGGYGEGLREYIGNLAIKDARIRTNVDKSSDESLSGFQAGDGGPQDAESKFWRALNQNTLTEGFNWYDATNKVELQRDGSYATMPAGTKIKTVQNNAFLQERMGSLVGTKLGSGAVIMPGDKYVAGNSVQSQNDDESGVIKEYLGQVEYRQGVERWDAMGNPIPAGKPRPYALMRVQFTGNDLLGDENMRKAMTGAVPKFGLDDNIRNSIMNNLSSPTGSQLYSGTDVGTSTVTFNSGDKDYDETAFANSQRRLAFAQAFQGNNLDMSKLSDKDKSWFFDYLDKLKFNPDTALSNSAAYYVRQYADKGISYLSQKSEQKPYASSTVGWQSTEDAWADVIKKTDWRIQPFGNSLYEMPVWMEIPGTSSFYGEGTTAPTQPYQEDIEIPIAK